MYRKHAALLLAIVAATLLLIAQPPTSPVAAQSGRPNIIVIITDDQAADSLPIMRKVMANPYGKWLRFTTGVSGDAIGAVSRISILTGQYTHHHGITGNKQSWMLNEKNTLPVWLNDAGYYTGLIGKYLNGYPFGRPRYTPPGWDHFSYLTHKDVDRYNTAVQQFLTNAVSKQEPFFLWLAHRAPQRPARPPARYKDADVSIVPSAVTLPNFSEADVSDKPAQIRRLPVLKPGGYPGTVRGYPGYMWDPNWIKGEQTRSLQQTMAIDDGVQQILDLLAQKGELDNTIIFYLSDTGYSWGFHRIVGRDCPYEECIKLPFLIFYPDMANPGGAHPYVVRRPIANVDITATIVAMTGIQPRLQPQDGISLLPLLRAANPATAPWPDMVLLEGHKGPYIYGIRTLDWKYVEYYKTGERELYDLVNDPYELRNLAGKPQYAARQAELAAQLKQLLARTAPIEASPGSGPIRGNPPALPAVLPLVTTPLTADEALLMALELDSSAATRQTASAGAPAAAATVEQYESHAAANAALGILAAADGEGIAGPVWVVRLPGPVSGLSGLGFDPAATYDGVAYQYAAETRQFISMFAWQSE